MDVLCIDQRPNNVKVTEKLWRKLFNSIMTQKFDSCWLNTGNLGGLLVPAADCVQTDIKNALDSD